ncbi:MAG: AraC family transcriptional regulator [Clostridiales bacterium]|nr:AraC family transcriptional regulator [Clostridiales bacterium]
MSCFLMIALPIACMGGIWYGMMRAREQEKIISNEEQRLDQIVQEAWRMISDAALDMVEVEYGQIYKLYMLEASPVNTQKLIDELANIKSRNTAVHSVYFYNRDSDRIYSTIYTSADREDFIDTEWLNMLEEDDGTNQYLPVRESLDGDSIRKLQEAGWAQLFQSEPVITIVSDGNMSAYFVVNISVRTLAETIRAAYINDEREMYLITGDGEILADYQLDSMEEEGIDLSGFTASVTGTQRWETQKCMYFVRYLGYDNLFYLEKIPLSLIYESSNSYLRLILLVIAFVTICMTVLSNLVARRLYRPIGILYQDCRESQDIVNEEDEIALITRTFHEMERKKAVEGEAYDRERELLRAERLRMFLARMLPIEDFLEINEDIFREGSHGEYLLVVCRLKSTDTGADSDQDRNSLNTVMNTYLSAKMQGIFVEYRYGVYVALCRKEKNTTLVEVLKKAIEKMRPGDMYFVVSPPFSIENIHTTFQSCIEEANNQYFFEDCGERKSADRDELPIVNYEAHLIRSVFQCDKTGIRKVMEQLQKRLYSCKRKDYVLDICQSILLTVDKEWRMAGQETAVTTACTSLRNSETLREAIAVMQEAFLVMADAVAENVKNENWYCREARRYINENYMKDINISEVADHLEISYAYLSKIYKAQYGEGEKLLDYLNRIRIEKARKLLLSTDLPLNDIARQVGYNNTQSLARFFKKYENMTPGDYRKREHSENQQKHSENNL